MSFAFTYFVALFASWLLIPYFIRHSARMGMIDHPTEERKSHQKPISRAGGLGIIAAPMLALTVSFMALGEFWGLLLAAIIIVAWGIVDDMHPMSASKKFMGQIVAVIVVITYGGVVVDVFPVIDNPHLVWANYAATFLFLLGVTNAVNMTDGLDGLAAGSTLMSLGLIFTLSYFSKNYAIAMIAIAIMGGISGFLRYNTHPAQVFMGDSGSQFIGFMTGALAILCTQQLTGANYSIALPLLILGLPIIDTLYVMLVRMLNKRSPFRPDRNHLHHRLIRLNFPHHEAVGIIYLVQTLLIALAYSMRYSSDAQVIAVFLVFACFVIGTMVIAKRVGWRRVQKRRDLFSNADRERRSTFFRSVGEFFDLFAQSASVFVVAALGIAVAITYFSNFQNSTLGMASAFATLMIVSLCAVTRNRSSSRLLRIATSSAAALVFFTASAAQLEPSMRYMLDGFLLLFILLLVMCVRITRDYLDILNNQDLLILCMLLVLPFLPIDRENIYLSIRIAIVVYVVEYLVLIKRANQTVLVAGCAMALLATSITMLI